MALRVRSTPPLPTDLFFFRFFFLFSLSSSSLLPLYLSRAARQARDAVRLRGRQGGALRLLGGGRRRQARRRRSAPRSLGRHRSGEEDRGRHGRFGEARRGGAEARGRGGKGVGGEGCGQAGVGSRRVREFFLFFSVSLQRSGRSKEEEKTLTLFFNLAFNQKIHLSGWSKRPSLTSKRAGSASRPRPTTRRPRPGPRRRGSGPPRGAPSRTRSLRRRGPSTTPRSRPRGGSVREQFLRLKKEKPSQNRERREGVSSLFLPFSRKQQQQPRDVALLLLRPL